MKKILFQRKGHDNGAYEQLIESRPHSPVRVSGQGELVADGFECIENFELLPVITTVVATSAKVVLVVGTNSANAGSTKSLKGGVTEATAGADNDQQLLRGIANTGMECAIRAASQLRFRTQVSIASLAACFASFGVNENPTDPDPSATAGEGALFLFIPFANLAELAVDPTVADNGGLVAANFANWILAEKVNGVDKYYATSIPVVAGADYELEVRYGADLKPNFYINGDLVRASSDAQTADDKVFAFAGVEACTGSAKSVDVRYISLSRLFG